MLRPCLDCGEPTDRPRCKPCRSRHEALRPPRRAKGRYDSKHMALRIITLRRQPWCSRCRTPGTPANPLQADHIVPLERGGKNVMSNYQTLCRDCNVAKRDRLTFDG